MALRCAGAVLLAPCPAVLLSNPSFLGGFKLWFLLFSHQILAVPSLAMCALCAPAFDAAETETETETEMEMMEMETETEMEMEMMES